MTKLTIIFIAIGLLAAGCSQSQLKQEIPSSPQESYDVLPK